MNTDEEVMDTDKISKGSDKLLSVLFDATRGTNAAVPAHKISETIIGCAYIVSNALGCGFIEKVYENALAHELRKVGLRAIQQQKMDVRYDGIVVGRYEADIIVEDAVIVEVKAARTLDAAHKAQCLNYLKATGIRLGLVINFGAPRVEIRRVAN